MARVLSVALLLMLIAPAAALAEAVVLSSTAPGMTVGRVLADDETLALPEDSVTTLLLATGRVLKLNGPYDGRAVPEQVASAEPEAGGGWSGVDLSALGGTRGELLPTVSDGGRSTVAVALDQPGTWCLGPGLKPVVARPADGADRVLVSARTAARARVSWRDGAALRPWPDTIPSGDGETVMVETLDGGPALPLRLRHLPAEAGPMEQALAGCRQQAAPQLKALGDQISPFSLFLSTDRGRTPRYAIGEPVTLVMQVNRPAELYCFLAKDGRVTSIFPGAPGRLGLRDHYELRVPGNEVATEIATSPPPGLGEVRCFAIDRSAGPPPAVDMPAEADLDRLFETVPKDRIAQARLFLRIN